jgi:hypothetical protein
VKATRKGLEDFGAELPETEQRKIHEELTRLESLIAGEHGNSAVLKATHAALDEATKPLAQIMMDKAMEAMLKKKGLL